MEPISQQSREYFPEDMVPNAASKIIDLGRSSTALETMTTNTTTYEMDPRDERTPNRHKQAQITRCNLASSSAAADSDGFTEQYYFLYGTLMDTSTLRDVLQLSSWPELRPAKIVGYHCKLWGQFPALLESGDEVHGMAYWVQSMTELERLIGYEGDLYARKRCMIHFNNGQSQVLGSTFVWCGDEALLKEGDFDLKDYQMMRFEMTAQR
ncbi:hypothetical protein DTO280E4_3919 [Paecilomyces variotii]|nr:hypothetical protein DTO280E4_3919 [Paecilomyces variotii]